MMKEFRNPALGRETYYHQYEIGGLERVVRSFTNCVGSSQKPVSTTEPAACRRTVESCLNREPLEIVAPAFLKLLLAMSLLFV